MGQQIKYCPACKREHRCIQQEHIEDALTIFEKRISRIRKDHAGLPLVSAAYRELRESILEGSSPQ